jgi:hypothetical protein
VGGPVISVQVHSPKSNVTALPRTYERQDILMNHRTERHSTTGKQPPDRGSRWEKKMADLCTKESPVIALYSLSPSPSQHIQGTLSHPKATTEPITTTPTHQPTPQCQRQSTHPKTALSRHNGSQKPNASYNSTSAPTPSAAALCWMTLSSHALPTCTHESGEWPGTRCD